MPPRSATVVLAALFWGGCATLPPPTGPLPLYDFDTVWLNEPVGGVAPWKPVDRKAATRAAERREAAWMPRETALAKTEAPPRAKAARAPAPKPGGAKTSWPKAESRTAKAASTGAAKPKAAKARKAIAARIAPAAEGDAPAAAKTEEPRPRPSVGLVLGDGSVSGELLAAARRVLGIRGGFGEAGFLGHLLAVAAIDLRVKAPRARFVEAVWEALRDRDRTFDDPREAEPGDLVFFHGVLDLDGDGRADDRWSTAAVVEEVEPSGVLVCLGEVSGPAGPEVRRFRMDPARPRVRRDEASGLEVNSAIRRRSLDDGPDAPAEAGALLAGFARP